MKIATYNINNVVKRLTNLLDWLDDARPDVVCLQELKATDAEFPAAAINKAGYSAVWRGERSWNGVAILSRVGEPVITRDDLPGDETDKQSRYIEAAVNGVLIACLYAPNGNPQPGPKYEYKLAWHKRFNKHAKELIGSGAPVVLAGDFNIVPEPRDVYPTSSYDDNALVQPSTRQSFRSLLKQGWIDAVRKAFPEETVFTFWDYRRKRWERNAGLRLDHLLLAPALASRLSEVGIDRQARGAANASDHAPVWLRLS